jgi:hypothetical protein
MEPQRSQDAVLALATGVEIRAAPVARSAFTLRRARTLLLEPFRISNTELPENVLLLAKTLTLAFLATGQFRLLSWHFLPFLRFFDRLGSPAVFHWTLVFIFLAAAAALFYNYRVGLCCLVLGGVILVSLLSSRVYFENNRAYCACILLLAGLSARQQKPWALRLQVVLVYFGAALNKLLQADWRSGQFFAYWFGQVHHPQLWAHLASVVPAMPLAQFVCWATITTEFVLVAGFLVPKWYSWSIWLAAAYHTTLLVVMNSTFGMFYYAMLASYLAFVEWPKPPLQIDYQDDLGFVGGVLRWLERLDADKRFHWAPFSARDRNGISGAQGDKVFFLIERSRIYTGFAAFKRVLLLSPATYFFFVVLLGRQPHWFQYHRWAAAAVLIFFTPFLAFLGESIYRWAIHHGPGLPRATTSKPAP